MKNVQFSRRKIYEKELQWRRGLVERWIDLIKMIEGGLSGQMNERRCLREQMNGTDSEQCHGLQQKKRGVTTQRSEEASRENSGVNKLINILHCAIFLGQCCPTFTADTEEYILKSCNAAN